ncbi:hypothetical protein RUM44_011500 [Polyplax serrata]|uniref:Uncharacterized protein n=1 Tax=Polyplax serrata TaxID=468196 RepID=A0ABR1AQ71_POLSC
MKKLLVVAVIFCAQQCDETRAAETNDQGQEVDYYDIIYRFLGLVPGDLQENFSRPPKNENDEKIRKLEEQLAELKNLEKNKRDMINVLLDVMANLSKNLTNLRSDPKRNSDMIAQISLFSSQMILTLNGYREELKTYSNKIDETTKELEELKKNGGGYTTRNDSNNSSSTNDARINNNIEQKSNLTDTLPFLRMMTRTQDQPSSWTATPPTATPLTATPSTTTPSTTTTTTTTPSTTTPPATTTLFTFAPSSTSPPTPPAQQVLNSAGLETTTATPVPSGTNPLLVTQSPFPAVPNLIPILGSIQPNIFSYWSTMLNERISSILGFVKNVAYSILNKLPDAGTLKLPTNTDVTLPNYIKPMP